MIDIVRARLHQGHRTTAFPHGEPPELPEHFRGRPLVDRTLGLFLDARPPIPEKDSLRSAADVEKRLRDVYTRLFETFHRHRALGRLLFEEAVGADKGFAERLDRHFRIWHERVRAAMRILQERALVRRDLDVDVSADLVLGMVERLARRHLFQERSQVAL